MTSRIAGLLGGLALTCSSLLAFADTDPLRRPALQAPRAAKGVMLAVAAAGPRWVAVGERGIALWSDDQGRTWHQAEVPVSVTLTAVSFASAQEGWAVGHGGAVLHTADGGRHWALQFEGRAAAQLELAAARAAVGAGAAERMAQAERLMADGPDKPFLAVHFWNPGRGFVVGAYGLIFGTEDGGATWASWGTRVDNPKGLHLNALYVSDNTVYLVGEQGLLLRSQDAGHSFQRLASPYSGSWFAITGHANTVLIAGLRGNVFWSDDAGASWAASKGPVPVTVGAAVATDRGFVLANQAGQLMTSGDGRRLQLLARPPGVALTALASAPDGGLMAASFAGAFPLPKVDPALHP